MEVKLGLHKIYLQHRNPKFRRPIACQINYILYKRILNRRRYNFNLTTSILSGDFSFLNIFAVLDIDSIYLTREDLDKIMTAD